MKYILCSSVALRKRLGENEIKWNYIPHQRLTSEITISQEAPGVLFQIEASKKAAATYKNDI